MGNGVSLFLCWPTLSGNREVIRERRTGDVMHSMNSVVNTDFGAFESCYEGRSYKFSLKGEKTFCHWFCFVLFFVSL